MRTEINWLDDALASKDIVLAMTHYRVKDRMMNATNGRIVAGYPYDMDGEFLVPGAELSAILKRLPDEPTVKIADGRLTLRSGRFHGSLQILPQTEWTFPELVTEAWRPFPHDLVPILRDLRPFVSDNAVHLWSMGIAVDNGWCYASNNIVLAGAPYDATQQIPALLPAWVIDFVLGRTDGLKEWTVTPTYMAFRWTNGAWMRSTLIDSRFPDRASAMIRETPHGTQPVDEQYRKAVTRIAELSDDAVSIFADRAEGRTLRSVVTETLASEVPNGSPCSIWSAENLALVMAVATKWSPSLWPKPVPFEGERIRGYIAGRVG